MPDEPAPLDEATRLAFLRTWVALDRTLLAWTRTSLALITFGFSVYKFFQLEPPLGAPSATSPDPILGARGFAIVLISVGVLALVGATVDHRLMLEPLRERLPDAPRPLAFSAALVVTLLGVAALLLVLMRG